MVADTEGNQWETQESGRILLGNSEMEKSREQRDRGGESVGQITELEASGEAPVADSSTWAEESATIALAAAS